MNWCTTASDQILARVIFGKTCFGGLNIDIHVYIYFCKNIIGGVNIGDLFKNHQTPKFTPRQYFVLYGIYIFVSLVSAIA